MCPLLDVPIRFDPKGTLMRGTIQKKGKKWYAVVYDGVNPATGEYRRRWVQAGTRRGDAEKLLAELVKRSHRRETVVSENLTLGKYLTERWLPGQEARLRKSTHDSYRRNIELLVIPALGKRKLDQLTPEDIDVFYAALLKSGRKKRPGEKGPAKGLAPKSVYNIHVMLNKALGDAARKGTVVRNVVVSPMLRRFKRASVPRSRHGRSTSSSGSSMVVVGIMAVIALGVLEPANIAVLFEMRKPQPDVEVIDRLMKRFVYTAGITGLMQIATLLIMTRVATQ